MTTNVFWAGTTGGKKVVSIFNNPTGQTGSNLPLTNPTQYLDRVYFDTRFDYLNILWQTDFVQSFPSVSINPIVYSEGFPDGLETPNQNIITYTVALHGFGYIPAAILIDYDTREIVSSTTYIQSVNSTSYRIASLLMDSQNFYIRERYLAYQSSLPSITRRYTLLAFSNQADVPAFPS